MHSNKGILGKNGSGSWHPGEGAAFAAKHDVNHFSIIIITGLSGSGKSTALAALEDSGYFCVDNLPVELLPKFLELPIKTELEMAGFGFVMDLREKGFLKKYPSVFGRLRKKGYRFEILFLEADEEVLIRRYSQTRRQHPLAQGKGVVEGIRTEKELFQDLRVAADKVIDTSRYNVHELKSYLQEIARKSKRAAPMKIHLLSFGYKYGVPTEADLVLDVRFLLNPFFVSELRHLDGTDPKVKRYVLEDEETVVFLKKSIDFLEYLIPQYEKEGKAYLTVAIGCTGGQHRSVAISQVIHKHLLGLEKDVSISHRDIDS